VAANLFETSFLSSGRFAADRGAWLTSLRASNLDVVTGSGDSDVGEPRYSDVFSKLSFNLGPGVTLATGALLLNDEVLLRDSDEVSARADDRDRYVWVRLLDDRGDKLTATYLLTSTELDDRRRGSIADPDLTVGELHEQRRFVSQGLKADWAFRFSPRRVLRWGAELEDMSARYEFLSHATFPAPIDVGALERPPSEVSAQPEVSGQRQAAYLSYRFRPALPFTVETGLRWDRQTYLDDATLSPRVNLLFDVGRATLRAAWGRFYQAQDPSELPVGDGATSLYPTQESEHTVLGLEYPLGDAGTLRLEAYRKRLEHLRPRFENLYYRVSLLPELLPDRVMIAPQDGEASGIELAIDRERGPWSWWFALARSSVRDRFADGSSAPRSWDEPWSVKAGATWTGPRWTATVNATTHAGWPAAGLSLTAEGLVAEARDGDRLPTFATLDVKAIRRVELARGRLSWFLELDNAFDRTNPCCLDYSVGFDAGGRPIALSTARKSWVPLVPSVGFMWEY
jgi:hypothetical protein